MHDVTTRSLFLTLVSLFIAVPVFAQGGPPSDPPGHVVADTVQQRAWQRFQQKHGAQWQIRWSDRTPVGRQPAQGDARKAPVTVFGALTKPYAGPPVQAARAFLSEHRALFEMPPGLSNLEKMGAYTSRNVTHVRFRQTYEGIPVYEGQYLVHVRSDGRIDMANGNYYTEIDASTSPNLTEQAARRTATDALGGNVKLKEGREVPVEITSELVVYPKNDGKTFLLAWKVIVPAAAPKPGDWLFLIDAATGDIIEQHDRAPTTVASRVTAAEKRKDAVMGEAASRTLLDANAQSTTTGRSSVSATGHGTVIPDYPAATSSENRDLFEIYTSGYLNGTFTELYNDEAPKAYQPDGTFYYDTANTHFDEVNVYYHITVFLRDYMAPKLGFTSDIGDDRDLEAEVHDGFDGEDNNSANNASYSPSTKSVYFGNNFPFAKEDKIIYHESTHAVLDVVNGRAYFQPFPTEEGAIGEGVSDYLAGGYTAAVEGPVASKIGRGALSFADRDMENSEISSYSE